MGSGWEVGSCAGVRVPLVEIFGAVNAGSRRDMRSKWLCFSDCGISPSLWPLPEY